MRQAGNGVRRVVKGEKIILRKEKHVETNRNIEAVGKIQETPRTSSLEFVSYCSLTCARDPTSSETDDLWFWMVQRYNSSKT